MIMLSDKCHGSLLILSQHWWQFGAGNGLVPSANVGPDLCIQIYGITRPQ